MESPGGVLKFGGFEYGKYWGWKFGGFRHYKNNRHKKIEAPSMDREGICPTID
ncbi:unnamed protein product [marine sediment metagenome]|uniref:Uncharacterized protein n=1 Tax=marine sediment metagenome TaxID=412755 RepID=X0TKD5_9ZZZZ